MIRTVLLTLALLAGVANRGDSAVPDSSIGEPATAFPTPAAADTTPGLEEAIRRAAAASGGAVGVAVVHVETGRRVSLRGGEAFPLASVFKLPLAIELLAQVQAGRVRLEDSVDVRVTDLRPGYSPIAEHHPNGYRATVGDLLAAMVTESDNTAADVLLRMVGGPAAVTARMRALGLRSIRVDRSEGEIGRDFVGLPSGAWSGTLADFRRDAAAVLASRRAEARGHFLRDPRDTATPSDMARLLVLLQRGEALDAAGTAHLLNLMARTVTGPKRLRAGLPADAALAHKTGTCGANACINDAGLVTLPGAAGHAAVAVFVRGASSDEAAEQTIASIARAVYEAWSGPR
jgi:beta-lactamase class A